MAFSMRIGVYSRYIWAQHGLLSKASGVLCDLAGRLRPPCAAPRGPPLAARGGAGTPSGWRGAIPVAPAGARRGPVSPVLG